MNHQEIVWQRAGEKGGTALPYMKLLKNKCADVYIEDFFKINKYIKPHIMAVLLPITTVIIIFNQIT